ncbi:hypothetical protein LTS18_008178 [Coniosporium uncinatum]|uniref:Uncharacterized protein n=1 Tax=Coniosporium uncinatum TaxID=93489 RepID=A0ACC3D2F1_9PEZI|nr:hypothetical protein LTS18_008178 [Coniosporium uncinatum]
MVPSLTNLIIYLGQKFCREGDVACHRQALSLSKASNIDIDYDTISHALIFKALWSDDPSGGAWNEDLQKVREDDSLEVGVLNNETPEEKEELKLGGFLTVVGDDDHAKPALFSFPSRHHPLPAGSSLTYSARFQQPTGLHPHLLLSFPRYSLKPPVEDAGCSLHTYLTLSSTFFIDKYQLQDPLFMSSVNLRALRSVGGETDLEAPDYTVKAWGSAALLELATPPNENEHGENAQWTVDIPLHLRYLSPSHNNSGHADASLPWPVVFWACTAEDGTKMSSSPFDRTNLGYESLFGERTYFYHVPPAAGTAKLVETLQVPVLDLNKSWYVEWGTVAAVVLGALWVASKLSQVAFKKGVTTESQSNRNDKGKKAQ